MADIEEEINNIVNSMCDEKIIKRENKKIKKPSKKYCNETRIYIFFTIIAFIFIGLKIGEII